MMGADGPRCGSLPPVASPIARARAFVASGASRLASALTPAPRASAPFGAGPQPPATVPPLNAYGDQPPPPPEPPRFDPAYHGHTFRSFAAPLAFGGFDLARARAAIETHDIGLFIESSTLAVTSMRFGPVFAALGQAIAPALALPRIVTGGTRGLARTLAGDVEAQLAPRRGLLPSPYFPPTLWGSAAIDLRLMGFAVLQHVYGDPDPLTGVRPIYTRRWPTWAVQYRRWRRTYVAITNDGPVDIISGDGKFTLLGDTEEPHFDGAIRALAEEVLDGRLTQQARANYVDRYGSPKLIGTMPEKVPVRGPEGDAMFDAMATIRGPDGFGVIPHGAEVDWYSLSAQQSTVFKDSLENVWQYVAAILLGSDGTMSPSTGVYSAPIFAGVRRDLIDRMLKAMVRGVNLGHVAPWLAFNFLASIEEQRARGIWVDPVLDIPLPDPDADARMKSYAERVEKLHTIVKQERDAGFQVTQERVNQLAEKLDVEAPVLAPAGDAPTKPLELAPTDMAKVVTVNEARVAAAGLQPLPPDDPRGALTIAEIDALSKAAPEDVGEISEDAEEPDLPADGEADTEGATMGAGGDA